MLVQYVEKGCVPQYQIREDGVVFQKHGDYHLDDGTACRFLQTKKLRPSRTATGRMVVNLKMSKKGAWRTFSVSRLVAEAFLPNPDEAKIITHIDGNLSNCRLDNLRWGKAPKEVTAESPVELPAENAVAIQASYLDGSGVRGTYVSIAEAIRELHLLPKCASGISTASLLGRSSYGYLWQRM